MLQLNFRSLREPIWLFYSKFSYKKIILLLLNCKFFKCYHQSPWHQNRRKMSKFHWRRLLGFIVKLWREFEDYIISVTKKIAMNYSHLLHIYIKVYFLAYLQSKSTILKGLGKIHPRTTHHKVPNNPNWWTKALFKHAAAKRAKWSEQITRSDSIKPMSMKRFYSKIFQTFKKRE